MTKDFPRIETERLILRPWEENDLLPFSMMNADTKVMEFFPSPLNRSETEAFYSSLLERFKNHGFSFWAAELKVSQEFIGFIGLNIPSYKTKFSPFVEVGWRLRFEHWNKGYATEGALASLDFGFKKLGLREIVSFTAIQNFKSQKVMEKIGMIRDHEGDFAHPSLAPEHWLSQHVLYRKSAPNP